jgi:hypothetical protein
MTPVQAGKRHARASSTSRWASGVSMKPRSVLFPPGVPSIMWGRFWASQSSWLARVVCAS